MVYNFALSCHCPAWRPPGGLKRPLPVGAGRGPAVRSDAFLNILDTHDGIGLMGIKGILTEEDIGDIVETARQRVSIPNKMAFSTGNGRNR